MLVVELNTQVGSQVEFAGKVSKNTLEEGVDGFDAEVAIVMDEVSQGDTSPLRCEIFIYIQFASDLIHVVLRLGQPFPDAVKLTEDAILHFLGGLVGKGHGKYVAISIRIVDE